MVCKRQISFPCAAMCFRALAALVVAVTLASTAAAGENYALLVAVGDYDLKELRPLKFTRADVIDFHKALVESGFPAKNIVLMHDDLPKLVAHYEKLGPDYKAKDYVPESTKVRRELELMLGKLRPDDSVVVAFSGHGVQFQGEKKSYYCPSDAKLDQKETLIAFEEVFAALKESAAGRKLLLIDACQNDPQSTISKSRKSVDLESITRPQTEPVPEGIIALFSCKAGQKSFELPELGHGVFFYHLLEGWKGGADANADGKLSYQEIASFTEKKTSDYAATKLKVLQTPQLRAEFSGEWVLRSIDRSDKLQPGSVWVGDPGAQTLTILERAGDTFRGRFVLGSVIVREVKGSVSPGKISWLGKDVRAVKGSPGGDNFGTVTGDTIDFTWNGSNGSTGTFSLQRLPADLFQTGSVWDSEPATRTLTVLERKEGTFRAQFVDRNGFVREMTGTVSEGMVSWLAKDVRANKGSVGGDNVGALRGETIDFVYRGQGDTSGKFTLRRRKPE